MATPAYHPIKGGTETVVRNLSTWLNEAKVETDVLTFNMNRKWHPAWNGKVEKMDGIKVFKIPALNWFPAAHSNRVTLGINLVPGRFTNLFKHYDIVHFHEADLSFPLFSSLARKPKIFHLHGFDRNFLKRYALSRFILKHVAELHICLTESMKRDLVGLGFNGDRIRVLPNAVDIDYFSPSGPREDNLVLFVGRISYIKGVHVLMESLSHLRDPIHLVIIGPPDWDHKYVESMKKLIDKENKKGKHRITYLDGQDQSTLLGWYRKATIFVLPSLIEAFGVTLLEALSCGTPVVASNVGGIPEIIHDNEDGVIIPPNKSTELAHAIQRLLDDKKTRSFLGQNGREKVTKNFSKKTTIRKLLKIYDEMINVPRIGI